MESSRSPQTARFQAGGTANATPAKLLQESPKGDGE